MFSAETGLLHAFLRPCVLIFILISLPVTRGDIFTSIADLQRLLYTEKDIPEIINSYIAAENERLENLRSVANKYKINNDELQHNLQSVSNPINAFRMIKRLTNAWKELEEKMKSDTAEELIQNVSRSGNTLFPSNEDLNGAVIGLLRLQDTYRLDTKDLANGILNGKKISKEFTAFDCFEIGRMAYNAEDYYHTLMWMEEALVRSKKEMPPTSTEADILEYLAFALYKQGNVKKALQETDRLYQIHPAHPRAKGNIKWYEDQLASEGIRKSDFRRNVPSVDNPRPVDNLENSERNIYEALCRNEVPVSVKETSKLYCYYKMDRPFLRLAPFKVEILRFNPLAVLFIGVMSEEETEMIQELAKPKLARATVQNSVTGQLETASYRISKSAWLKGTDAEVVDRINKRMDMMTNLEMETAEELQIANYGIGGHYDPHYDFARKEETKAFSDLGTGNRIATVLFYMTQPEAGGGTVFTELKSAIQPSKNNALFWYNLYRNGEGDLRTRHAACPVLLGVKWISNKWIHEKGQEFRRPCGLKPSAYERYVGDLGAPEPRHSWNVRPY
ncbi:2OG-Fe(II) oxygenase superfamily domain-containing protein [Ditylenchus destructor]|nr:2OG-Fe(II) oxygenase superfamily domain-containing protein [Ditylenchus destructor]